jgi:hypothetical protein
MKNPMRGKDLRALTLAAAAAAVLGAAPVRAEECGKSAEGFNEWLKSFREVAAAEAAVCGKKLRTRPSGP